MSETVVTPPVRPTTISPHFRGMVTLYCKFAAGLV